MSAIIEINHLTHRFADGTVGLDRVTLAVEAGAFVVIAGANGSGKTTLLHHLNGLLLPTSGSVRVAGACVRGNPLQARVRVGMVFQDADSQIVGETVRDDVAFGPENLRLDRGEIDRRVQMALEATGMSHLADHRPHRLSGGEKRGLAVAGILAMQPQVIVFDEPFSNLDYPGVRQVLDQILRQHRAGCTGENEQRWLSKTALSAGDLKEILTPFPAENLSMYPVSPLVNTPDTDDERVIQPMDSSDYQ